MFWSLSGLVLVAIGLAGCASLGDSPAQPLAIPQEGTVDQIVVGLTNGFGIDEQRPSDIAITDRHKIDRFVNFLNARNNNWRKPGGTFPSSQYTAAVLRNKETVLVLWLSPTWIGSDNRARSISAEEWVELARLLDLPNP